MTHVICRLTAKNRDHLRNPTLCNGVWATFTFLLYSILRLGPVRLPLIKKKIRGRVGFILLPRALVILILVTPLWLCLERLFKRRQHLLSSTAAAAPLCLDTAMESVNCVGDNISWHGWVYAIVDSELCSYLSKFVSKFCQLEVGGEPVGESLRPPAPKHAARTHARTYERTDRRTTPRPVQLWMGEFA